MKITEKTFTAKFPVAYEKSTEPDKLGKSVLKSELMDFVVPQLEAENNDHHKISTELLIEIFDVEEDKKHGLSEVRVLFNLLNKLGMEVHKTDIYTEKHAAVKPKDMTKTKEGMVRQMIQGAKLKGKKLSKAEAVKKVDAWFELNDM